MLASVFFFSLYCDPRDLHVLTHSFPTRRSSGLFGVPFHDFAGSVVVHAMGGWLAFGAVVLLGRRNGRYRDGRLVAFAPSNIPFLALGSWILIVGWFGFNVMSAQTIAGISGLVAEIGRASCRERECQSVWISVVAVTLKKKKKYK